MLVNSIVICIALIVDTYIMYKLLQLSNMSKKKGSVINFKERFYKRYVKNRRWIRNTKKWTCGTF